MGLHLRRRVDRRASHLGIEDGVEPLGGRSPKSSGCSRGSLYPLAGRRSYPAMSLADRQPLSLQMGSRGRSWVSPVAGGSRRTWSGTPTDTCFK